MAHKQPPLSLSSKRLTSRSEKEFEKLDVDSGPSSKRCWVTLNQYLTRINGRESAPKIRLSECQVEEGGEEECRRLDARYVEDKIELILVVEFQVEGTPECNYAEEGASSNPGRT